jgi:hypothetical protein
VKVLTEVNRLLKPDSIFMFSSHNRSFRDAGKLPPQWECTRIVSLLNDSLKTFPTGAASANAIFQVFENDYAIINDNELSYFLLTHYITIEVQVCELVEQTLVVDSDFD